MCCDKKKQNLCISERNTGFRVPGTSTAPQGHLPRMFAAQTQGSPTARKYSQLSSPATLGLTFSLFPSGASDKTILNRFILAYPVGAPRKKQVERLAFFYPIRRFGMGSPHEERCMESVAKRRHGITHWRVFSSD